MSMQDFLFNLFSCGSGDPIEPLPSSPDGLELKYITIDLGYEGSPQGQFWIFVGAKRRVKVALLASC